MIMHLSPTSKLGYLSLKFLDLGLFYFEKQGPGYPAQDAEI